MTDASDRQADPPFTPITAARCGIGGVFMGLANLVPGISGGTMLLAAGVYPRFIQSVADLSALRLRKTVIWLDGWRFDAKSLHGPSVAVHYVRRVLDRMRRSP